MKAPQEPPALGAIFGELEPERRLEVMLRPDIGPLDERGRYLHWDELRNRRPPEGLSHREWWLSTRYARQQIERPLPLRSKTGEPFVFCNVDPVLEALHAIDQQAGGHIAAPGQSPSDRARYLVSSLTEEAITSSQLEGATTTRRDAKRLLATGRQPRDKSELMIVTTTAP